MIAAPPAVYPWPIGSGSRYHPTAASAAVAARRPVGGLQCHSGGRRFAVHLELFAYRQVAIVPARIGVARGCSYPVRTTAPTGVLEVATTSRRTLGDLFAIWGRRLSPAGFLTFRGRVSAFVGGRRFTGDPRKIVLTPHAEIVLELGGYLTPHPDYLFPKGGR